jgi:hypothetical protein
LALKDGSSGGIGLNDVNDLLTAFEESTQTHIQIIIELRTAGTTSDPWVTALAYERKTGSGGAPPLASVSVKCSGTNLRSMEAVLIRVLYSLDGKLAEEEFARVIKKR